MSSRGLALTLAARSLSCRGAAGWPLGRQRARTAAHHVDWAVTVLPSRYRGPFLRSGPALLAASVFLKSPPNA